MKAFLAKKRITKIENVASVVSDLVDCQPPQFWKRKIAYVPSRWETVVSSVGGYIVEPIPLPDEKNKGEKCQTAEDFLTNLVQHITRFVWNLRAIC